MRHRSLDVIKLLYLFRRDNNTDAWRLKQVQTVIYTTDSVPKIKRCEAESSRSPAHCLSPSEPKDLFAVTLVGACLSHSPNVHYAGLTLDSQLCFTPSNSSFLHPLAALVVCPHNAFIQHFRSRRRLRGALDPRPSRILHVSSPCFVPATSLSDTSSCRDNVARDTLSTYAARAVEEYLDARGLDPEDVLLALQRRGKSNSGYITGTKKPTRPRSLIY